MAANDEFPRGLLLTADELGGTFTAAVVTFPAVAGCSWVLTDIDAIIFASNAVTGWGGFNPFINTTPGYPIGELSLPPDAASGNLINGTKDTWSWSGKVLCAENTALLVEFTANNNNLSEILNVQAYLI